MKLKGRSITYASASVPVADLVKSTATPSPHPAPGSLEVSAVCADDGTQVSGVAIKVMGLAGASTGADGKCQVDLSPGPHVVIAVYRDAALDHVTFYSHYPELAGSRTCTETRIRVVGIRSSEVTAVRVEFRVLKLLSKVVLYRRHIDLGGRDQFGHWWTVIDDTESFGWWPKYPLGHPNNRAGPPPPPPAELPPDPPITERIQHFADTIYHSAQSALYSLRESRPAQTLRGVEGELNGRTSFGGSARRYGDAENLDPHHINGDLGDVRYQPVVARPTDPVPIKDRMRAFANAYDGGWSWRLELGNNCHTFQKSLVAECGLERFKAV